MHQLAPVPQAIYIYIPALMCSCTRCVHGWLLIEVLASVCRLVNFLLFGGNSQCEGWMRTTPPQEGQTQDDEAHDESTGGHYEHLISPHVAAGEDLVEVHVEGAGGGEQCLFPVASAEVNSHLQQQTLATRSATTGEQQFPDAPKRKRFLPPTPAETAILKAFKTTISGLPGTAHTVGPTLRRNLSAGDQTGYHSGFLL